MDDCLKKLGERCIYRLVPCLCNAIKLAASVLTIHKVGAGRRLIDVSSKFMPTKYHSMGSEIHWNLTSHRVKFLLAFQNCVSVSTFGACNLPLDFKENLMHFNFSLSLAANPNSNSLVLDAKCLIII